MATFLAVLERRMCIIVSPVPVMYACKGLIRV